MRFLEAQVQISKKLRRLDRSKFYEEQGLIDSKAYDREEIKKIEIDPPDLYDDLFVAWIGKRHPELNSRRLGILEKNAHMTDMPEWKEYCDVVCKMIDTHNKTQTLDLFQEQVLNSINKNIAAKKESF